ncbi:MAG: 30S ribosomal protein S6 [Desulforegulaceae bacterium]|jgi:small subunit ribosomal protein S6|nr:30S ribosomal protein S6 [Desulforegulaceae bacterium]
MKRYETIIVMDPDTGKETWEEIYGRMLSQVEKSGGVHLKTDDWGSLKLAYEIRKKTRGHYYRVEFCAPGDLIKEMERYLRLDEKVMRYLTVLIDENANIEQIKAEMEEKENLQPAAEDKSELDSEITETSTEEDL